MESIKIQESEINLTHGRKGKIAIFMYIGFEDPVEVLDDAVSQYVGNESYNEFIDIEMDNPQIRLVISGLNEMEQEDFIPEIHKLRK